MCGIAGFYNATVPEATISKVTSSLFHRGPDSQDAFKKNDVGLIHTRLSILELSPLGAQPYHFENISLVFNGELYNFKEVRDELKKAGYSFLSNSDTEVLIKAFHCWREKCIDKFIGMFAFAMYDHGSDELFLFRDRAGVKPLYYSATGRGFFFASELRAILDFGLAREINQEAVALYFRFGFVPHPLSVFKGILKVDPGHYLKITRTNVESVRYWHAHGEQNLDKKENEWLDELESLLISSFSYRMVSDVPVGIFLSGGIDSSLLTAILKRYHGNLNTFTIGFRENNFDETLYAKKVADHLHVNHTEKILEMSEARTLLKDFYNIYDEPFADTSGIPTSCVTTLAKQHGMKVVLSADGGDELFGGYTHYLKAASLMNKLQRLPQGIRSSMSKSSEILFPGFLRRNISAFNLEHKAYALEELLNENNPVAFFESFVANQSYREISNMMDFGTTPTMTKGVNGNSAVESMMSWDFNYFLVDDLLVKVDRATMFNSVECREPFLDHRLIEFSNRIPLEYKIREGKSKYLLRKLLSRYVPSEFFERPKQGFSIPIFDWFKGDLDKMFNVYFTEEKLKQIPFFNSSEIMREHSKYLTFKKRNMPYNIEKMWRLLSFMMWWDKYVRNES